MELTDLEKRIHAIGKVIYGKNGKLPVILPRSYEWERWRQWRKEHNLPWEGWGVSCDKITVVSELPTADLDAFEASVIGGGSGKFKRRRDEE